MSEIARLDHLLSREEICETRNSHGERSETPPSVLAPVRIAGAAPMTGAVGERHERLHHLRRDRGRSARIRVVWCVG
jgi:hypothetical protein